jgi:hypothetical protein
MINIMSPYHWWQRWWFTLCEWNSWNMTAFICQVMWWNHQRLGSNCYCQVFLAISYKQIHPWNWTWDGIKFNFLLIFMIIVCQIFDGHFCGGKGTCMRAINFFQHQHWYYMWFVAIGLFLQQILYNDAIHTLPDDIGNEFN